MKKKVKLSVEGYHKVIVGTDLDVPTVVIWFEHKNKVVDSDLKDKLSALALGELIQDKLQTYIDLSEEQVYEEDNSPERWKTFREG